MDAQPTNAPGASKLSGHELRTIHAMRDGGATWRAVTEAIGAADHNIVRNLYNRARLSGALASALGEDAATATATGERIAWSETAAGATLEAPKSSRITTLDQLLAAADVDLTRWEVERWVCNKWEVGAGDGAGGLTVEPLWQVKAWLRPSVTAPVLDAVRAILADAAGEWTPRPAPAYPTGDGDGRHMMVIAPADLHYGMYSWGPETGVDYDSAIAANLAERAVDFLLRRAAGFNVERILIPLGHDWFHADRTLNGAGGTTTRGTNVEVDDRWQRMFRGGAALARLVIERCRERAPVHVVMVPGNHDTQTAFYLGEVMAARYEGDDAVTVTNDPAVRHYLQYGVNGLALMHGDREKKRSIPNLFAAEAPAIWAACRHRAALVGHLHRAGLLMCEDTGFLTHELPSLSASDGWHAGMGYRHRQACQSLLYDHDAGYVGGFHYAPPAQDWHWSDAA